VFFFGCLYLLRQEISISGNPEGGCVGREYSTPAQVWKSERCFFVVFYAFLRAKTSLFRGIFQKIC
jgi:hypothetical protein